MKKAAAFPKLIRQEKKRAENQSANLFVFCDKTTGVSQFRAESEVGLESAVERIAGLLAMQCLVRGQEPQDFEVMVPAQGILVERLVTRAQALLEEGRAVACPGSLSPRQKSANWSCTNARLVSVTRSSWACAAAISAGCRWPKLSAE